MDREGRRLKITRTFNTAWSALLMAVGAATARAAEGWVVLPTASPNITFSVDLHSVRRDGPRVKFWERLTYVRPEHTDAASGKWIKEKKVHRVMDCERHSQGFIYGALYAEDGAFIESTALDQSRLQMAPIPPGTLAEKELELVCGASGGK